MLVLMEDHNLEGYVCSFPKKNLVTNNQQNIFFQGTMQTAKLMKHFPNLTHSNTPTSD